MTTFNMIQHFRFTIFEGEKSTCQDVEGLQPPELPPTSGRCQFGAHGWWGRPSFRGEKHFENLSSCKTIVPQVRQWEPSVATEPKSSVVKRSSRTVNSYQEIPKTTFSCAAQVLLTTPSSQVHPLLSGVGGDLCRPRDRLSGHSYLESIDSISTQSGDLKL